MKPGTPLVATPTYTTESSRPPALIDLAVTPPRQALDTADAPGIDAVELTPALEKVSPQSTIKQALKAYVERVSIHKRGAKQETYRTRPIWRSFLGKMKISSVTTVDIAAYRDMRLATIAPHTKRLVTPNTVRLELAMLSDLFNVAQIEWGACASNPVSKVRKPKLPPGRDRRITFGEERRLLRAAAAHKNPEMYSIISLAIETAMRQGEILSLEWENIDLRRRIAHLPITKNGEKRDVPLSQGALSALTRLGIGTSGKVFKYKPDGLKSAWRVLVKRLCIENLHFHDLRHEAVSRLFELGTLDYLEIATISGHKSVQMLKRYTHLRAETLVPKLDGKKKLNLGKRVITQTVVPYPASLGEIDGNITLQFLDLPHIQVSGDNIEDITVRARDILLRELVNHIKSSQRAPLPTPPLEYGDSAHVLLIDPL
ncbi:site-specific integrase [Paraburkholderia fungorum]|uniref:site-specific integrase n=1 Tax=Paraburkholderia fungorum TaxID=134537 RepID=UPI001622B588